MKRLAICIVIMVAGLACGALAQEEATFTNVQEVVTSTTYSDSGTKLVLVPGSTAVIDADTGSMTIQVRYQKANGDLVYFSVNNRKVDSREITMTKGEFNAGHAATSAANPMAHNQKAALKVAKTKIEAE